MALTKTKRKSKKVSTKPRRKERRFVPSSLESSKLAMGVGALGATVLGAGVYRQWIVDPPAEYGAYLVAGGALVLGAAMWFGDVTATPVRVGDAGVAIERGTDLSRLAWCDVERISVEGAELVVTGDGVRLAIPMTPHKAAVAWILKEAAQRVPDVVDVKGSVVDGLPEPRESDGERIDVKDIQVAGRRCAATDQPITFEKDARLCPNCGQVYLQGSVPKKCVTCDEPLGQSALSA